MISKAWLHLLWLLQAFISFLFFPFVSFIHPIYLVKYNTLYHFDSDGKKYTLLLPCTIGCLVYFLLLCFVNVCLTGQTASGDLRSICEIIRSVLANFSDRDTRRHISEKQNFERTREHTVSSFLNNVCATQCCTKIWPYLVTAPSLSIKNG